MYRSEVASPDNELMLDLQEDADTPDAVDLAGAFRDPIPSAAAAASASLSASAPSPLEIGGEPRGPRTKTWQAALAAKQAAKQQPRHQRSYGYGATPGVVPPVRQAQKFNIFQMPCAATGAYNMLQQAFAALAAAFLVWSLVQHLALFISAKVIGVGVAPSPSPGSGLGQPCSTYTYPQCEDAMKWYLQQGTKDRCQAFERVKAEGDMVKFPYTSGQEVCAAEGCCGCPGQCSRCPPLLPECSSWQLDGIWRVAFEDGSEAIYTFDTHGHCEVKLPESLLPPIFKEFDSTYIPQAMDNGDLMSRWVTEAEGKQLCVETAGCQAISFDLSQKTDQGHYYAHLKSHSNMVTVPGNRWRTLVRQPSFPTQGGVTAAGPLVMQIGTPGTFTFDLHRAAPHFFEENSVDVLTVTGGELQIERRLNAGKTIVKGTGVVDRGVSF